MTPGAVQGAGKRNTARARVSGALGVSVALHVLGAVALWRGASEPERVVPGRPLEVQLVWRDASRSGVPGPASAEAPAPRPAPPGQPRKRDRARAGEKPAARPPAPSLEVPAPAPGPAAAPSEPAPEAVEPETPPGGPLAAVTSVNPGEASGKGAEGGASGGGAAAAEARSAGGGSPGGRGSGVDSELVAYREQLSRRVTRQRRYPAQAVRLGLEGTVRVRVRINPDGALAAPPRLEGTSRFRVLDAEALRMVEAAAPFAPLPSESTRGAAEFIIPVSFSLRASAG